MLEHSWKSFTNDFISDWICKKVPTDILSAFYQFDPCGE